jgi:molecular chaperone HtpG
LTRGTRITLHLKDDAEEFAYEWRIREILRKYSSFVPFPVLLNGEVSNTVQAIWKRSKSEVSEDEYKSFYQFIGGDGEEPRYRLHFSADAPLAINALLYVPEGHTERMGFGRMDPGVDLYCKKILIQKHPEHLLPEWMRFVKGVVDSDDLPLNISRETMQDSALIRKLAKVITGRFLRFLTDESKENGEKYDDFFRQFGHFIKEGVSQDMTHRVELAKLLRVETSKTEPGKYTSLVDYVARMKEEQRDIYYINGPSREAIEAGPYIEALRARDYEVIFNLEQLDDFVFDQLREFDGKQLRSADSGNLELPPLEQKEGALPKEDAEDLCAWLKVQFGDRVGTVRVSTRLVDNPAAATTDGPFTATMQRLMSTLNAGIGSPAGGLSLEINPGHGFIGRLNGLRKENEGLAKDLAEQLLDNSLLGAGLLADPRAMVSRLNKLLSKAAGL